jgi:flagellar biosynthesis GTPase FlhF
MKVFNPYHKGIRMSTNNEQPIFVGSINDAGILSGLKRKGITPEKSLSELFANSIDAGCNEIRYKVFRNNIKIIDDGKGMNMEAIQNMFDIHKENHKNDKSLGVSGVGAKAASLILSNDTMVVLYTKCVHGEYYKVEIPWDEMLQKGKYTNMIRPVTMSTDDIVEFHKERETMKNKYTGVTIKFKYSDKLKLHIEKQFCSVEEYRKKYNSEIIPENQLGVIYGAFPLDCSYEHYEEKELRKMAKYNYFGGEDNEFYKGKTEETISVYEKEDKPKRYILNKNGEQYEIKQLGLKGKQVKKDIEKITESFIGWSHLGNFILKVGCRRDDNYFNDESSEIKKLPDSGAENHLKYEEDYFGDVIDGQNIKLREYFCKPELKRNNQIICSFDLPDEIIGNRRANAKSMFGIKHLKCQLSYDPVSSLNNPLDLLCGIQENKNQCSCQFEKSFLRLIYNIKNQKANEIWDYFDEIVKKNIENEDELHRKKREEEEKKRKEEKDAEDAEKLRKREEKNKKKQEKREREQKEREQKEKLELERIAEEKRKAKEESDRKAKEEADRKAKEEERKNDPPEVRKAKEEADRKAKEEAERKAKEEAERKAKEEAERKSKEEAERKAKEEADRKAREEKEMREHNEIILGLVEILGKTNAEKLGSQMNKVKNPEKYLERKNAINIIRDLLNE